MRTTVILALSLLLTGCATPFLSEVADRGTEGALTTICRAIPVGAWQREFGASAERAQAWRTLCQPQQETPAFLGP